ncbi:MAG: hypothetical protein WAO76_11680 [Georgfuchsia sp.]
MSLGPDCLRIRAEETRHQRHQRGSPLLREWVDNPAATPVDLDLLLQADESSRREKHESVLLYRE